MHINWHLKIRIFPQANHELSIQTKNTSFFKSHSLTTRIELIWSMFISHTVSSETAKKTNRQPWIGQPRPQTIIRRLHRHISIHNKKHYHTYTHKKKTFLDDYPPIDRNPFAAQQPNETFSRFRQHRQLNVHLNEPINIGKPDEAKLHSA